MKALGRISASFVVVLSLLLPSRTTPAHAVEVYPLAYDFGEVEIGTSSSTFISIVNYTGHSHILTRIAFCPGSSTDFSIATDVDLPMTLESLDRLELEVVFSPSVTGLLLADLEIVSIDNSMSISTVSLRGGTGTEPPPGACVPSMGN